MVLRIFVLVEQAPLRSAGRTAHEPDAESHAPYHALGLGVDPAVGNELNLLIGRKDEIAVQILRAVVGQRDVGEVVLGKPASLDRLIAGADDDHARLLARCVAQVPRGYGQVLGNPVAVLPT